MADCSKEEGYADSYSVERERAISVRKKAEKEELPGGDP